MIDVIFTDTHFGWKNNSMTWLNSQMRFIYEQFIPTIVELKRQDKVRVIHCGDVFDSRSTISTYVASKVVQAFKDIRTACDEFVIVCGNHDFYSPNSDTVNTVELFMSHMDIKIVDKEIYTTDRHAFVPWYVWENGEFELTDVDYVFCHADIVGGVIPPACIGKSVFSGHIHIPHYKETRGLYNLGSCYSLNFADSNSVRGFYIIKSGQVSFETNKVSINFHRLYNEEVLTTDISNYRVMDYVELYISQENMSKESYVAAIKKYTEYFTNLWIIPQTTQSNGTLNEDFTGYDIEAIMEASIPEDLTDFFQKVKNRINLTD